MSDLRAALAELADDFASNVDWSAGRDNYGDNEAWERAAREVRELLATHPEEGSGASEHVERCQAHGSPVRDCRICARYPADPGR